MSSSVTGLAARLERLLAELAASEGARERAEELVRTVVGFYGEGLERLLTILHESLGARADDVFARLCEDKVVEGLFCLHGLHPLPLKERIEAAIQSVLPYIQSHRGSMELSRIEGDVVFLRLEGSCDGCPSSATTLKLAVERAILERAPEIREVRAEDEVTLRILSPA